MTMTRHFIHSTLWLSGYNMLLLFFNSSTRFCCCSFILRPSFIFPLFSFFMVCFVNVFLALFAQRLTELWHNPDKSQFVFTNFQSFSLPCFVLFLVFVVSASCSEELPFQLSILTTICIIAQRLQLIIQDKIEYISLDASVYFLSYKNLIMWRAFKLCLNFHNSF